MEPPACTCLPVGGARVPSGDLGGRRNLLFTVFTGLNKCKYAVCFFPTSITLSFTTCISNTHLEGDNSQYIVMATTLLILTTASPPTKVPRQPSPSNPLPLLSSSI